MQKLKTKIIDKMIEKKITGIEVNFILYLSHYQDESGTVRGIYYKDACDAMHISVQSFYNAKSNLERKGFIRVEKHFHSDWDIQILDNDFLGLKMQPGCSMENYLNTGQSIFCENEFMKLKAREKLLAMLCIKIAGVGSPNYHIETEHFFEKYTKLFGVKKRALQNYLTNLKKYFAIGIRNRQYWISPLRKRIKKEYENKKTDRDNRAEQIANVLCRRYRLENPKVTYVDLKKLIEQYYNLVGDKIEQLMADVVEHCLARSNKNTKPKKWKRRYLRISFVHKVFKEFAII